MATQKTVVLKWDDAKKWLNLYNKIGFVNSASKGIKGYFKVGKRDYTAFRINDNGILRVYNNIQHEGDCIRKLKLPKLL